MKLVLKNVSGESVSLFIEPEETFRDLRKRVNEELGISLYLHDLTIQGKVIDEAQRVSDYFKNTEIQDDLLSELQQDVKCAVPTCENTKFSCPDKAFFFFPTEEMRSHQWALYCHRLHDSSGKVRLELNNQSVICADHFRKDQFVKNSTTLLKRLAVPCVNPEVVIISESSGRRRPTFRSGVAALPKPELTEPLPLTSLESALSLLQHTSDSIGETSAFCRLCSNSCLNCVLIFDDSGKKMNIAEKINSCLPITVKETDPLPKQVCRPCLEKLSIVYEMADTCVKAETKLQAMMADKQFSSHALPSTDLLNPVPPTCLDETVDEAGLGNMTSPKSLFGCPLCTCGKMVTKSGIYRVNKDSIDSENSQDLEKHSNSDDAKVTEFPDHKIKPIITNQNVVEGTCKNNIEPNKTNNISEHLLNGQDCSLKIPDFEVDALYNDTHCIVGMELDSIPVDEDWEGLGMKKETKVIVKDEKEVLVCRLCGIEFSEITALLDHSEDHSDTSCFPCTVCEHWFENKTLLDSHFLEKHCGLSESGPYHCEACGLSFKSVLKLETHFCGSIGGSNKCTDCNKSFRSEARLEFHMRFHNGAQPGYCEICKKTFPDELKLYKHTMYLHGQNKGHCCEECGKVFKSNSSLRYHQRTHQGEKVMKPFTCEYCGKCFIRKSMLRSHFLNIHKDKTQEGSCFTCKICFEAFPSTDQAVSHMDMMHMAECTGVTTYSFEMHTVKRLYLCEYCERCFTDSVNLNSHREQHPSAHPYQCKFCIESFSSSELLGEHKRLHITAGLQDYVSDFTVPTVYMCEFCDRCFMSCIKLSEHLTVHYGEEPYHCRFCSKKFKTHTEVAEHRLSHDKSDSLVDDSYRPYECHYCPKTFGIEDALVKHIRMHTGEKPFICDQCGKGFSQSSGLYTHQKVHSNERPYRCGVCSRTFKIKGDRDVHVRKHSGDRPYKCDFCGKAFMTQHVYSQHRKIHTGERPYKCDVCGIAFRRSHVLTVHKRIHTGEKPNVCDVCGRRYRQKGDMLKHRRLQHGIVKVRIQKIEF